MFVMSEKSSPATNIYKELYGEGAFIWYYDEEGNQVGKTAKYDEDKVGGRNFAGYDFSMPYNKANVQKILANLSKIYPVNFYTLDNGSTKAISKAVFQGTN